MKGLIEVKKSTLILKSVLFLFLSWLAGFFISTFFPMCYQRFGVVMCFVFGFCTVGATVCIFADFASKAGGKMNTRSARAANPKNEEHFGLWLGAVPTAVNYVYVIILWLSKLGALKFDFFPWYKTLTFYFMPLTYIVAPNAIVYDGSGAVSSTSVPAPELSIGAMILFTLLPLIFLATTWSAFYVGYNHVDLKAKILYGGKK